MAASKEAVREFWEHESCGERYATGTDLVERLKAQASKKYELEPYIRPFARFEEGRGKRVLEIGVGMGVDHAEWARISPRELVGVDLTARAVEFTRERLGMMGLSSDVRVADAETLPFDSNSFDIVYSWGVLHHTPNTAKAIREVHRVLRPGGRARIMIYRKHGVVFLATWARFAVSRRGGIRRTVEDVIASQVESPGTKVYDRKGVDELFRDFQTVTSRPAMSHGDLLEGDVGARHRGALLTLAKALWPRWVLRRMPPWLGSQWLIEAVK